jgi:hypothetical protein
MKIRLIVLLILFVAGAVAMAALVREWKAGHALPAGFEATDIPGLLVNQRVCDLGTISPNHEVTADFLLMNASDRSILVSQVRTNCGYAIGERRWLSAQ